MCPTGHAGLRLRGAAGAGPRPVRWNDGKPGLAAGKKTEREARAEPEGAVSATCKVAPLSEPLSRFHAAARRYEG